MSARPSTPSAGTVLVVEDEPLIAETLEAYLRRDGFHTERAGDGRRALDLFRAAAPDLVLLDLMLPEVDGWEVLRAIRAERPTPVIVITARSDEVDRLVGLELGADDYVVKPFSFREVVARVRAVLRRTAAPKTAPQRLQVGRLTIEPEMVRAAIGASALPLTATEFRLLAALAETPGRVFARSELIERCMPDSDAIERTVDSHLRNVRRKLGQAGAGEMLETVRGIGYRLVAPR